ncbi:hypothetical protein PV05_10597 [Exophiala xenobiotica]|uniref:Uncharacterized protein n=1 Tax=Exophiala xenobiotica TaxID=348802 RepID=A0A0D2EVP6_9EURO|nr:uncharacterized protein PV05_10597 [Exophiala xenobiotica]KIW51924.1 hypothetical protein PV05_10597 [Exophiala xenobiotica]
MPEKVSILSFSVRGWTTSPPYPALCLRHSKSLTSEQTIHQYWDMTTKGSRISLLGQASIRQACSRADWEQTYHSKASLLQIAQRTIKDDGQPAWAKLRDTLQGCDRLGVIVKQDLNTKTFALGVVVDIHKGAAGTVGDRLSARFLATRKCDARAAESLGYTGTVEAAGDCGRSYCFLSSCCGDTSPA